MFNNFFSKIASGALCIFTASFLIACSGSEKQIVLEKTMLDQDTIWQGNILIKGDVEVPEGITLTIMPGTVIKFAKVEPFGATKLSKDKLNHFPGSEIIVKGKILAQGTPEEKIIFTSAEKKPTPGDWGSVNMLISVGNIIEYCDFSYAHTAVHCHSAHAVVTNSNFHHNGVAIGQKNVKNTSIKSVVPIFYNTFTENGGAILFGGGSTPSISRNDITNNSFFGIYAKKGGKAVVRYNNISKNGKGIIFYSVKDILFRDNNIESNTDYNISMLDGQETDIVVQNNWWGTTDKKKIKKTIRDKESDDTLGHVDFSDYLKEKVITIAKK